MSKGYGTEPIFRISPATEYPHEREGRRRPHPYAHIPEPVVHHDAEDVASVLGLPAEAMAPEVVEALSNVLEEIERLRFHNAQSEHRLRHLEHLADHHTIVPALNRRGFIRELESFLTGGESDGVLAVIHVGGVEALSAVHGLAACEGALRHICATILQEMRATDLVGCIGPSDFAILMTLCGEADARAKLDDVIAHVNDPSFTWMGQPERLAVQWGMHPLFAGEGAEQALATADRRRRGLP